MWRKLRRFGLLSKSLLFTVVIHGVLIVLLIYSFNWVDRIKRGGVEPIQAVAVPARDLEKERAAKALEELEKRKREEEARKQKALADEQRRKAEEEKKKQEAEKKRKAEEQKKLEAEKKKRQAEQKRKAEEERKKQQAEQQRQAEEERKKREAEEQKKQLEAERRKKLEAEKKRREAEEQRKLEAEKKRKEEEAKRLRAEQLRKQLEAEQLAKTKKDAADALSALVDRIAAAVERNWLRPRTSQSGLTATIRVKVARDGRVTSARVTKSSGDPFFDQSAERAVQKASPLPFPANPEYYEFINEFDFKFSPDEL